MISIVTPTFNRAKFLPILYQSLLNQTSKAFEWIIIDDGSADNTQKVVEGFVNEKAISICYIKKRNGGKHRALNTAMQHVNTDFVFIVDSDDYITVDAVETVIKWCKEISSNESFAGTAGLRAYSSGKEIGGIKSFTRGRQYIDATNLERRKYRLGGDKAEIYKTSILKKYPFPEFENEIFLPEDAVWNAIAKDGYKIRWHNRVIYFTEYLEDGLTVANKGHRLEKSNFIGYTYVCRQNLLYGKDFISIIVQFLNYYEVACEQGLNFSQICERMGMSATKAMFLLAVGKSARTLRSFARCWMRKT